MSYGESSAPFQRSQLKRSKKDGITMQTQAARRSLLPSALVLCDILNAHAGDPPVEALEQAGFRRNEINSYLERRAGRSRCSRNTQGGPALQGP
jgi:hypothetical protein